MSSGRLAISSAASFARPLRLNRVSAAPESGLVALEHTIYPHRFPSSAVSQTDQLTAEVQRQTGLSTFEFLHRETRRFKLDSRLYLSETHKKVTQNKGCLNNGLP